MSPRVFGHSWEVRQAPFRDVALCASPTAASARSLPLPRPRLHTLDWRLIRHMWQGHNNIYTLYMRPF